MLQTKNIIEIAVADVVFREDLYPRQATLEAKVQQYAEDLSVLPPIEINEANELIDGWHRWTAHRKKGAKLIKAVVTSTGITDARAALSAATTDAEKALAERAVIDADTLTLELACERNSSSGAQMSVRDKKIVSAKLYRSATPETRGQKKRRIAEVMSLSYETINKWMGRIDKDGEEERNAAVQNLYLQCFTQEEIAERVGMPRTTVDDLLTEIGNFQIPSIPGQFADDRPEDNEPEKKKKQFEEARSAQIVEANTANAQHESEFEVPIYNVWKQQTKSETSSHFGNSEVTWVDRLLYLYTQPFDIVVDPFAGGGSTLDICKKRFRRCWISDRAPIEERQKDIRCLDLVTDGLPDLRKRWSETKLVYLDPPYWLQAQGQYSEDPTDLANMPLDQFNESLSAVIHGFAEKLTEGYIALIIQPTQWKAPDRQFTDHVGDMLRMVKPKIGKKTIAVDMRFSVPYESQQCTAQMVEWAKENKRCLVLSREIVVWKVA